MEKNIKVSIIMPAYNSENYVAESIESVIAQTVTNWELLAIDDGSTDGTGDIIDLYASRDRRIRPFHTEKKGVSHARNIGLDNSNGEWIFFLDSDDILLRDSLENLLAASDGQDLVIGNYCEFPSMKQKMFLSDFKDISINELVKPTVIVGAVWGMIFRKSNIQERFPTELQYGEDSIFLYGQLRYCSHISTINNIVYLYRRDNIQSLTHQKHEASYMFIDRLCELLTELLSAEFNLECKSYIAHIYVKYLECIITSDLSTGNEKKEKIKKLMYSKALGDIPLIQLSLPPKEMHLFALLKMGDILLIEKEFKLE